MIEVPYWWDRKYASLLATVYSQRPELFTNPPTTSAPIPQNPPSVYQKKNADSKGKLSHYS